MTQVVRAFSLPAWQFVQHPETGVCELTEGICVVSCYASGYYLDKMGIVPTLNKVRDKVGVWLQKHLACRLLVGQDDDQQIQLALAKHPNRRLFLFPGTTGGQGLADHILLSVCEPLLRDQGLLVWQVDVRFAGGETVGAKLPPATVERYLAEAQGLLPTPTARERWAQHRANPLPFESVPGKRQAEDQSHAAKLSGQPVDCRPAV